MLTKENVKDIKHEVASDLVREYLRGPEVYQNMSNGVLHLGGWNDAIRSCATRMGVYDEFCALLDAQRDEHD